MKNSITFIDARIPDIDSVLAGLPPEAQGVMLDPARDGVQQLAAALVDQGEVEAIHIVSHGAAGALFLGAVAPRALDIPVAWQ